jgi:pimeloyl-ACP methyl ester carboxylesterase
MKKYLLSLIIFLLCCFTFLSACSANNSKTNKSVTPIYKVPIKVIDTSDGTVSYRVTGNGYPLVLIMGYSASMDAWAPSFVDLLAKTHKVYIFDNAGIGQTSMPISNPSQLTITDMAQQTNAFIKALKLNHPDVLGWSMGGMIAQALSVLYPSDVNHLILCATLPGNGHAQLPSITTVSNLSSISALTNDLFTPDHPELVKQYVSQLLKYPHFYLAPESVINDQTHALITWSTGHEPVGKSSNIKQPTLIADGNKDVLIPLKNNYIMHKLIRHSQLVIYPDASHAFLFQYENQFVKTINKFLGSS